MIDKTTEELAQWLEKISEDCHSHYCVIAENSLVIGVCFEPSPSCRMRQAAARLREMEKLQSTIGETIAEIDATQANIREAERWREERDQLKADNERLRMQVHAEAKTNPLEPEVRRLRAALDQSIDVVFDKLPGPESCVFIEVEQPPGTSVCMGTWLELEPYAVLRIKASDIASQALEEGTP